MIYGHPAPCLVTRLRRGAVMVEPLRFIPLSEIGQPSGRLEGRAPDLNHGAQSGAAARYAAPGEQMRAVSTPRRPSGSCPTPAPLGQPIHESRSFHAADNIERIQQDHV